jgi:Cu/Ag efflux protein CusF
VRASRVLPLLTAGVVLPWAAHAHAPLTTTVQFDREVVRILDNHCVMCHVDNGPAFPLVTYEQTYAARWKIRQDALDRHMAPWAAVSGYGDFVNSNGLTQREIDFLASWSESFGPRNNGEVYTGIAAGAASPKVIQAHTDFDRWALGNPDGKFALPEAKQHATLDPKLTTDRWLRGLEYKPGDRRVVRAVSFSLQETGQWLGTWTPWYGFVSLPHGLSYKLPARSHIVADIQASGGHSQGTLGLYFSAQPSQRAVASLTLDTKASGDKLAATTRLDADTNILALEPQIRPGLRSVEVAARAPDGTIRILLFARDIPTAWPTPYVFRQPVALPKGTELTVIEHTSSAADAAMPVTFSTYQGAALASEAPPPPKPTAGAPTQHFKLTATVKSVDAAAGRLVVQHGNIPGFMGAMTMSYAVGKNEDLSRVKAGDTIQSDVVVSGSSNHLENIEVTGKSAN